MRKIFVVLSILIIASMALSACVPATPVVTPQVTTPPQLTTPPPLPVAGEQPNQITGGFTVSNDFVVNTYFVEQAVALLDMYGFVTRDKEWEMPVSSQTLGYLSIDPETLTGEYALQLPALPTGQSVDVDNNGTSDAGVQVFAVGYSPNLTGGPYSEGDDASRGWPSYLASVKTDSENNDEVIGGSLVVWAPDANQQFPTGFGEDGLLFTADDPVGPIPAGYSIVNLDTAPFSMTREAAPVLELFEPKDVAIKDYSSDSYTDAFDQMFKVVSTEYAFNGIEGKQPDWESLYAELKPRVEEAEKNNDPKAFYEALRDFTYAFKDGHVGLDGGDYANQEFADLYGSGYGFAIRELEDGRALVIYITEGGPAEAAGVQVGDELLKFNGLPVAEAIGQVLPPTMPHSTDFSLRYQQGRYLLRAPLGTNANIEFTTPEGDEQTATLTSVAENASHRYTSVFKGFDPNALPVEFKILDSGVGYIKVNSNYDDLNLIIRLFERALKTFQSNEVPGIIIDMRQNSGGAPLGLAGFLTDQEITMGQLEYYSEATGQFEPEGLPEKIFPNTNQYSFPKTVLMVDQGCASACEIESYGFSQVPGMIVVGQYPSAGVEAEVARGQFSLPEGFTLQIPTGRFTLPDGSIFLEGKGVQPTLWVPIDETLALSTEDEVLKVAEQAALEPLGAGMVPSGPPAFDGSEKAIEAAQSGVSFLEDVASEQYDAQQLSQMDTTFPYTIALNETQPLLWVWGWCAKDDATLAANLELIQLQFTLDNESIPAGQFYQADIPGDTNVCRYYLAQLTDWPGGEHHLTTSVTFTADVDDGSVVTPAGAQVFDYSVFVKP